MAAAMSILRAVEVPWGATGAPVPGKFTAGDTEWSVLRDHANAFYIYHTPGNPRWQVCRKCVVGVGGWTAGQEVGGRAELTNQLRTSSVGRTWLRILRSLAWELCALLCCYFTIRLRSLSLPTLPQCSHFSRAAPACQWQRLLVGFGGLVGWLCLTGVGYP